MLLELRVENYAVIDNVVVEFGPGLNLLTGETGAGKSILIDALSLLLGDKASPDMIRHGSDKAVVACVFESQRPQLARVLEENGLDSQGEQLILRREILASGKGRVFVNNQPATVAVLRQLAAELAIIHAQNESIMSFDAAARLALLDSFANLSCDAVAEAFGKWKDLREHIAALESDEQDRLRLLDLWKFQHKEIAEARLEPDEDERLETEKRVLANAEKLYGAAMGAYDQLYDSNTSSAATLRAATRQLEELARYDSRFQESVAALDSARAAIEDVAASARDYAASIDASPERLAEIEDRLALLDRLKRKYGQSLGNVIAYGEEVARKLNEVENRDDVLRRLRQELAAAGEDYLGVARALSQKRYEAARKLEKLVESEVNDLAMKCRFKVQVEGTDDEGSWTASGLDRAIYLVATNPGEPLKPVEQIASGGELSRVMLALKATVDAGGRSRKLALQRTLVFDEIDTGIGGRAAESVGKKLKSLARTNQVICITHLPQIASFADQHYVIEKRESGGRTRTSIRRLEGAERTEEIARMLSGAKLTDTSRKHAEQMLKANA